jgi:hypothetical protein
MEQDIQTALGEITGSVKSIASDLSAKHHNLSEQVANLRAEMLKPHQDAPGNFGYKSIGQQFVEHPDLGAFSKRMGLSQARGSFAVEIKQADLQQAVNRALEVKTTITTAAVGRATPGILNYDRIPGVFGPPPRRVRVRDLIPFYPTSMSGVDYVKRNVFTNAASPQTEADAKAESALTFVIGSAICQTIAHWIPAAKQLLEDAPQLAAFIDTEMLVGLADEEDYQLLRGDGVAPHIEGMIHAATAYAGVYDVGADTRIDKIAHALQELESLNFVPDGIVVNPLDWRAILLLKTEEGGTNKGQYLMGGPSAAAARRIWELPVVTTTAMPAGKFLIGQFQGSVKGFERMGAVCEASSEHADYWIRNLVAIRAEERIALAITRAAGLIYGSF